MTEQWRTVEVEMLAFGNGAIRPVDIPVNSTAEVSTEEALEVVYFYGQNDFQPKPFPSVSVGDVVRLDGKRFKVHSFGFEEIKEGE